MEFQLVFCPSLVYIYRQAQESQHSLKLRDPVSFPQGRRKLHCRPGVMVTAAGSRSELDRTDCLGMRTHRPTPYESIPEISPTEGFCLCHCAGKQGGGQGSARHQGGSTDGASALGRGGEAPPPSPPRAAPEQSCTPFPTKLYSRPLQFSVLHQEELFLVTPKSQAAQLRAQSCGAEVLDQFMGRAEQLSPKETGKMSYQESPQLFP